MAMKKFRKITRQDWQPNALVKLVRNVWVLFISMMKILLGAVATVLFIGIVCGFVVVGALGDYLQEDILPSINIDADARDVDQTSFIYYVDSNGDIQQMQKIYTSTDRQWASIEEIPDSLVHAAIAIEDKRFYEHQGVDWITTVKACANMFFGSSSTFGGSTITQQMWKNYTQRDEVTVQRKVREIFEAQQFEMEYDKDVVMEWYLNYIYLGEGCYGVKSAAWEYYGKELDELTIADSAALISITNNPSLFDPYLSERSRERNRERQLNTLREMFDQGWITQEEFDEAVAQEMVFQRGSDAEATTVHTCVNCGYENKASYYDRDGDTFLCPECGTVAEIVLDEKSDIYSWGAELIMDDVAYALAEQQGLEWNNKTKTAMLEQIKRGGYHIFTTLDMDIQKIVDDIYTDLDQIPDTYSSQQLQSAIVIIDNRTGDVVALAGGVGVKEYFDAFSHATDEGKQTGSVMKPVTCYAPAFQLDVLSPASTFWDLPLTVDDGAFPLNDTRTYKLGMAVRDGVADSVNTIAVKTLDLIGTRYSFDFASEKFGLNLLESEVLDSGREISDIGYAPLGLGALTYGVTVREMAEAYATFPSDGVYRTSRTFTKVYDSEGNLVIDNTQQSEQILDQKAVDYMNYCLRAAVTDGTAYYADLDSTQVCAKTGTTSNDQDRWFIGYTDYYTAAVWCGYKVPETVRMDGINPSGQLWLKVMRQIHEDKEWHRVSDLSNMTSVTVCLDSGDLATGTCSSDPRGGRTQTIMCYPEDVPNSYCKKHVSVPTYCATGDGVANQYCALAGGEIVSRTLLKFTREEFNMVRAVSGSVRGYSDDLVYLVDSNGNASRFYGLYGDLNQSQDAPYKVCTLHTAESLLPTLPSEPEETEP